MQVNFNPTATRVKCQTGKVKLKNVSWAIAGLALKRSAGHLYYKNLVTNTYGTLDSPFVICNQPWTGCSIRIYKTNALTYRMNALLYSCCLIPPSHISLSNLYDYDRLF